MANELGLLSGMPLVSVLITIFNGADLITSTIESLQHQTYPQFEIVVVDDGSTDNSAEVVRELAISDPRIRLFSPGRLGRGKALNYGLKQCQGEFIAINDADDVSHPDRLQKQVAFLIENPDYGLVGCYSMIVDLATGVQRVTQYPITDKALRLQLTQGSCFNHPEIVFRQSVVRRIGGYTETRRFLFDRDIIIRVAKVSKIAKVPEVLVTIQHHQGRFFYHSFKGRHRDTQSILLQMKAIHLFGFPKRMYLKKVVLLGWIWMPTLFKNLLPKSLRASIRGRISTVNYTLESKSKSEML